VVVLWERNKITMKRITLLLISTLIAGSTLTAQTIETERLYQKYRGEKGVVSIWLPGFVMKFAATVGDLEGPEEDFLRSIRSIRVLTIEEPERFPGVNFTREADVRSGRNGYQVMMQVTDSGEDILIMGRERRGKLKDMLILVGGDDNVMVHIKGRMNADMIGSIAAIAGVDNFDQLSQL